MAPTVLLQQALAKLSADDQAKLLAESRLVFNVGAGWYRFENGQLVNENGGIQAAPAAVTGVRLADEGEVLGNTKAPTNQGLAPGARPLTQPGVNAPTWHRVDAIKASPGAPFVPPGTVHPDESLQPQNPVNDKVAEKVAAAPEPTNTQQAVAAPENRSQTPVPIPGVTSR